MMPDDAVGPFFYGTAAPLYWEAGWRGVLPFDAGRKWPPPAIKCVKSRRLDHPIGCPDCISYTGYDGIDPSYADIMAWSEKFPDGNLGLRLPDGVIGIDIDAYGAKTGGYAYAEAVNRWGPLPKGPRSTSRLDDPISGIRLFRVPAGTLLEQGIEFPEVGAGDVEIIQRHHRYAMCWPSIHPEGRPYLWVDSSGEPQPIPDVEGLPLLPDRWLAGLKLTPRSATLNADGSVADVQACLTAGEQSPLVAARWGEAVREINSRGGSRHDATMRHVLALLRMGKNGEPGVENALTLLRDVFSAAVCSDGSRTPDEARLEFNRFVTNSRAARELAQPGLFDWFRQVMGPVQELNTPDPPEGDPEAQGANATRAESDGATDTPGAAPGPPEPNTGGELELLEQDFWTARPQHQLIYQAALSRMASPWAVFACCVARALAMVPPTFTLPPLIGGRGSLNWFAVMIGKSGGGKGSATTIAEELLKNRDDVLLSPIGSGEGMVETYNRAPGKGDNPPPPVISVMFVVDEIDSLGAMSSRSGQTTMSILRQGFSGENLGFAYRGRQSERVIAHTYRMTLVASVQPSRAGVLLDDSGGGTPQRFMWFPGRDRRITADIPDWPTDNLGRNLEVNVTPGWQMSNAVGTIAIPSEVAREIRENRAATMRDEENALDGHALFCREKLAFALAFMDSRTEITLEDWRLSGLVAAVSDWTRNSAVEAYQQSREDESRDRGKLRGVENASAEQGKMEEQTSAAQRVMDNVLDKIKRSMPNGISNRDLTNRVNFRYRGMVKGALDYAVSQGWVVQPEGSTLWFTQ